MNINWKEVCQSPGYISMQAAVADEAACTAKWGRKSDERYAKAFSFAINRAKHYAYHFGCNVQDILNGWEGQRDYNFISFYSNHHLPKFHSGNKQLMGVRKQIKRYKIDRHYNPKEKQERILLLLIGQQKATSKKAKPRWSAEYKARIKRRGY